jgi:hypothetical protein
MGNAGVLDPSWANVFHDDFNELLLGKYALTVVGTNSAALTPFDCGAVLRSNAAVASNSTHWKLASPSFKLQAGKQAFYKFAGQLSDVVNCNFYVGLGSTGTTLAAITDGILLQKAAGAAMLQLITRVGGVQVVYPLPATAVLLAGTSFELGISVVESGEVAVFLNPSTGGSLALAAGQVRGPVLTIAAPALPTALLAPTIGFTNSTAVARTLAVDYHTAVRER